MGASCYSCDSRKNKLTKAQKMTQKLYKKYESELEALEKKIHEDREELKKLGPTPGNSKTKKISLYFNAISNIFLYKRKLKKLRMLRGNSNLIEQKLSDEYFTQTLNVFNEVIQEGESEEIEEVREAIQKRKEEEEKIKAIDKELDEDNAIPLPSTGMAEINNFGK